MSTPEAWLRGPIAGVPPLLQPVAHSLLQSRDEVRTIVSTLSDAHLWERPAALASPAFHLQHLTGVLDRLFTYARNEPLTSTQLASLASEGNPIGVSADARALSEAFGAQVEAALQQLCATDAASLTEVRAVGRAALPSTVIGLLVHAAEHVQRHVGQLLVTARVLAAAG